MMTSLYSERIPVTEITSDWYKFRFPRDSCVITCLRNYVLEDLGFADVDVVQM